MHCICGSNTIESECCKPIVDGNRIACLPEQLMRSRYYSYAINNAEYIYDTYSEHQKSTSLKAEISEWCKQTQWIKLVIHRADDVSIEAYKHGLLQSDNEQILPKVTFSAFFIVDDVYCKMTEESCFIVENNTWRYESGNIIEQAEITKLTRNTQCPCNSGKKYKRCCMK